MLGRSYRLHETITAQIKRPSPPAGGKHFWALLTSSTILVKQPDAGWGATTRIHRNQAKRTERGDMRPTTRFTVFASCLITLAFVLSSPLSASAEEVNYQSGSLAVDTWKWSGHHQMTGAKAWGYAFTGQYLRLQNDGFALVTGADYIFTAHGSAFTVSKCGWTGQPEGQVALTTCSYTN